MKIKTAHEKFLTEKQKQTYYCPHCGHSIPLPKNLINQLTEQNKPHLCNYCNHNFYLHSAKTVYESIQIQYFERHYRNWLARRNISEGK